MKIWFIGATNVWKSTLFNRMIGQFRAIVTDIHGTTTDLLRHEFAHRHYGEMTMIDSPWLHDFDEERPFIRSIIDEVDIIVFVIDGKIWLTAKERRINEYLRWQWKIDNVVLVINKLDSATLAVDFEIGVADYYTLGYNHVVGISAKQHTNIGHVREAIDQMTDSLMTKETHEKTDADEREDGEEIDQSKNTRVPLAIVGKPNAGKSTLLNTLAWQELAKVSEVAWTTRDYLLTDIEYQGSQFRMYDTAWIRKKSKMHDIEEIAYQKTRSMLKYVRPLVVYLIDCEEWVSHRDMSLLGEVERLVLPMIIGLNKVDLVSAKDAKHIIDNMTKKLTFLKHIPIVPLSWKEGKWVQELFDFVPRIREESHKKISTGELNRLMMREYISRPPRFPKNKICKIMYTTQIEQHPPKFKVFVNHRERTNFSFKRWIVNVLRKTYWFVWVSIVLDFEERQQKKDEEE